MISRRDEELWRALRQRDEARGLFIVAVLCLLALAAGVTVVAHELPDIVDKRVAAIIDVSVARQQLHHQQAWCFSQRGDGEPFGCCAFGGP